MNNLRKTGIDIIGDIPWGTHLCQFYNTTEDLIDVLVPYFRTGLEQNEFCMWITSEPLSTIAAGNALNNVLPGIGQYLNKGQIEILPYTEWYLKSGIFDSDLVLKGWIEKLEKALALGYEGLRLSGNTFWLEKEDWDNFTKYEAKINEVIGNYKMLAICTYSLEKCGANEIIDVVSNHEFALIKKNHKWGIIKNYRLDILENRSKKAEEATNTSRSLLETVFASMNEAVVVVDLAGKILNFNEAFAYFFKFKSKADCLNSIAEFSQIIKVYTIDGMPLPVDEWAVTRALRGETGSNYENIIQRIDTGESWIASTSFTPLRNGKGEIIGAIQTMQDITARKQAEDTLRTLAKFPEENPYPVLRIDMDGKLLYANRPARSILESMATTGNRPLPLSWNALAEAAARQDHPVDAEIEDNSGHVFWITAVQPAGETFINLYLRDITAHRKAEEALERSRNDLNFAQAVGNIGSWRMNTRDNVLTWSDETHHIFGVPKGTPMMYEFFLSLVHPDDRDYVNARWKAALEGTLYDIEHRILVNGQIKWVREKASLEFDSDKNVTGGFGITQDITDRKKAEEILKRDNEMLERIVSERTDELINSYREMEKIKRLSDIGELAAIVAHELRNPLAAIDSAAYNLKRKTNNPQLISHFSTIENKIEDSNKIINNLLSFSRIKQPVYETVNIVPFLNEIVDCELQRYEKNITVTNALNALENITVEVDPFQIKGVFTNIMSNAYDALSNGGKIEITGNIEDGQIKLLFRDNGIGIDEKDLNRLFEPFFSTKSKGTGLGLAICQQVIQLHNGNIGIESKKGAGTTVMLSLPVKKV